VAPFTESIRLRYRNHQALADLVLVELETGLALCKMVRTSNGIGCTQIQARRLKHARQTLDTIENYLWKLQLDHGRLNEITSLAERIKFEVQNLERKELESM
jgi:hypothetical protein